jgi:hypothetical protein
MTVYLSLRRHIEAKHAWNDKHCNYSREGTSATDKALFSGEKSRIGRPRHHLYNGESCVWRHWRIQLEIMACHLDFCPLGQASTELQELFLTYDERRITLNTYLWGLGVRNAMSYVVMYETSLPPPSSSLMPSSHQLRRGRRHSIIRM